MKLIDKLFKRLGYVKAPKYPVLNVNTVEPVLLRSRKAFLSTIPCVDSVRTEVFLRGIKAEIAEMAKDYIRIEIEEEKICEKYFITGTLSVLPLTLSTYKPVIPPELKEVYSRLEKPEVPISAKDPDFGVKINNKDIPSTLAPQP